MVEDPRCLLAIEEKPNSFLPFSIQDLDFCYPNAVEKLSEMDLFISIFGEEKIKEALLEANIFPVEAVGGNLVILYIDEKGIKRKIPIIPLEYYSNYNLAGLLNENANDLNFINRIINKINNLRDVEEIKDNLKAALKTSDFDIFMQLYGTLPYFLQRNLYLYIIKGLNETEKQVREISKEVG